MRLQSALRTFFTAALAFLLLSPILVHPARAQRDIAGETKIREMLDELNNLGSVMMIAAHPDDENTALLAYLARGRHVRTAYLSLTRGEGGQNLIGSEQGPELGIIRTEELLAARRIDGAEQYFTRAIDFGFSKTADETLGTKWPREKVLGDVVWAIRRFRPDVIILRFTGTPRDGHGHHQASAILGKEAFSAAADPTKFPEQLKYVQTWQAQRLMTNLAAFNQEQQKEIDKVPDKLELDLGAYDPELGYSYNEIAGMSRSQHRSQAMGTALRKGENINYFVTDRGDRARKDIFEGINIGWSRLEGGVSVNSLLDQASQSFKPEHPEALVPLLLKARSAIAAVVDKTKNPLAGRKLTDIDEAIAYCAGVSVDAQADKFWVVPGADLKVTLTALVRSPGQVTLLGANVTGMGPDPAAEIKQPVLANNKPSQFPITIKIPESQPYSQPYWLEQPAQASMYSVANPQMIGDPESPSLLTTEFRLKIGDTELILKRPVEHRYVDRVWGERVRPISVVPPVDIDFGGTPMVFADNTPRHVEIPVRANTGKTGGDLHLEAPAGWKIEPASQHFDLSGAEEQMTLGFEVRPPSGESQGQLRAVAMVGNRRITARTETIDYEHIPEQTLFPSAESKLVHADIKILSRNIGYVMGAGDEVPEALRQIGCTVTLLSKDDLVYGDLSRFDAIVTGVRAWDVRADLRANYQRVYKYVENGGTLVVQYNVPAGPPGGPGAPPNAPAAQPQVTTPQAEQNTSVAAQRANPVPISPALEHMGPYPIRESRDSKFRVTVEEAPVTFPNPQLSLLHKPNEITPRDFEGWIQERGLNFAEEWDPRYQSVLESHDPGEKPLPGGELYTRYGKGTYIFSGYSWFRELPAGVPGAYRLFANMLSASKVQ